MKWLRSWWKNTSTTLDVVIILMLVVLLAVIVVSILGYAYNLSWSGLHGKTFWDWLQLLIIPAVLAVGGYLFNYTTSRNDRQANEQRAQTEREAAEKQAQTERDVALDNQREQALQAYINSMSELLLEKKLRESQPDDEVRTIARVRTITILFQLDARRIGYVFAFLRESGLMSNTSESIVTLKQADLSKINLSRASLAHAALREAILSGAYLVGANLSGAYLVGADLSGAFLSEADLSLASLTRADLSQANLIEADLSQANLTGAKLSEAYLRGAYLTGATVTEEGLRTASSLQGAIMPDGSKHD